MGTLLRLAALASLALVGACAGGGTATTPVPRQTAGAAASDAPGSPPTATPSTRPVSGPPTLIPDDVGLPHQWTWPDADAPDRQPLFAFCLDPGPRLRPPDTTDYRGRSRTTRLATRTESLGVYPDRRRAARAILAWRRQASTCANGDLLGHTGERYEWSVVALTVRGADEAWLAREVGSTLHLRDGRVMASTTVVARVGTAVYAEHTRRATRRGAAAMSARTTAEIASVTAYVPSLAELDR